MGEELVFAVSAALKQIGAGRAEDVALIVYLQGLATVDIDQWQRNFEFVTADPSPNIHALKKNRDFARRIDAWEAEGVLAKAKAATAIRLLAAHCTKMIDAGFTIARTGSSQWQALCILHTQYLHHVFTRNDGLIQNDRFSAIDLIDDMIDVEDEALFTGEGRIYVHHLGTRAHIEHVNTLHNLQTTLKYYERAFAIPDYEVYRASLATQHVYDLERELPDIQRKHATLQKLLEPPPAADILSLSISNGSLGVPLTSAPRTVVYGQNIAFVATTGHPATALAAALLGVTFETQVYVNVGLSTLDLTQSPYNSHDYSISKLTYGGAIQEPATGIHVRDFAKWRLPLHECFLFVPDWQFYPIYKLCLLAHNNKLIGVLLVKFPVDLPQYAQLATSTFQEATRRIELLRQAIAFLDYDPETDNGALLLSRVNPMTGHQAIDMSLEHIVNQRARAEIIAQVQPEVDAANADMRETDALILQVQTERWNKIQLQRAFPELFREAGQIKKKGKKSVGKVYYDTWMDVPLEKITGDIARDYIVEKYLPDRKWAMRKRRDQAQEVVDFNSRPIYEELPWHSAAATYSELIKMQKKNWAAKEAYADAVPYDQAKIKASLRYVANNWPDFVSSDL